MSLGTPQLDRKEALQELCLWDEDQAGLLSEGLLRHQYRRLALTHHPDKNGSTPESVERFQRIGQAFARVLADFEAAAKLEAEGAEADAERDAFSADIPTYEEMQRRFKEQREREEKAESMRGGKRYWGYNPSARISPVEAAANRRRKVMRRLKALEAASGLGSAIVAREKRDAEGVARGACSACHGACKQYELPRLSFDAGGLLLFCASCGCEAGLHPATLAGDGDDVAEPAWCGPVRTADGGERPRDRGSDSDSDDDDVLRPKPTRPAAGAEAPRGPPRPAGDPTEEVACKVCGKRLLRGDAFAPPEQGGRGVEQAREMVTCSVGCFTDAFVKRWHVR